MEDSKRIEDLIRELDAQKAAYLETFQKIHDSLIHNLAASTTRSTLSRTSQRPSSTAPTSERETDSRLSNPRAPTSIQASSLSKSTGDDFDHEDEALYVQQPLEEESFTEEGLRLHLKSYRFSQYGARILSDVVDNSSRLAQAPLLPHWPGPCDDRSHLTHSQIFDIASDGAPLLDDQSAVEVSSGRPMALWNAISTINASSKERRAVGRITIVREPSPILFAAVHYAMHRSFDMEELFRRLVEADLSSASMFRAFDESELRRRSFVFNFEYFTLIGKDCQPMQWQMCAEQDDRKPGHIQISRCSSVIALTLGGPPIKEMKNPSRQRVHTKDEGMIYDPFASWKVLNIQCYPDWKASLNVHDSTQHYVNGPDAFLHTLLGEFRDAGRRFDDITKRISRRVKPRQDFIFDSAKREQLLFEDDEYNIVKRYFWAHQTLGIMNESMEALIDAFEDTFTDDVWEGKHPTLWPLLDENSARNKHFRKKLEKLKMAFAAEMVSFRKLIEENHDRQKEIIGLREALFSGTSIKESRTTIWQGHNIKILTLVSIFFLPLTFVTSVFGMTNMPTARHYWMFGIVTATVCIPFFVLIGSLNSYRGLRFWRRETKEFFDKVAHFFRWLTRRPPKTNLDLVSLKSHDSDGPNISLRRWSLHGKRGRSPIVEEPTTREDGQLRRDGIRSLSKSRKLPSGALYDSGPIVGSSVIASMWTEERKRRLKYSETV